MLKLVLYIFLAIGVSFLCSILEAVLLSVTPSYIAAKKEKGTKAGKNLAKLKEDIDRPLAAILSLNTIAHTVGAGGSAAAAQQVFENLPVSVFTFILTLGILVLSEIIPKTLGATYWRLLAPWAARILPAMIISMYPLVVLSMGITEVISSDEEQQLVSREEFSALANLGAQEGVFDEEGTRVFKNLLRFESIRVRDIMTPRTVILACSEAMTVEEFGERRPNPKFSRIPVFNETRDDITGYVLKDEILLNLARDNDEVRLSELKRDILVVPELLSLHELFERLLEKQEHLALVVNEYGGTAGIVTMEDVVETLLGLEIVDEVDTIKDMQALARKQWFSRAKRLGLLPEDAEFDSELVQSDDANALIDRATPDDWNKPPATQGKDESVAE